MFQSQWQYQTLCFHQGSWLKHLCFCYVFERCLVHILSGTSTILTGFFIVFLILYRLMEDSTLNYTTVTSSPILFCSLFSIIKADKHTTYGPWEEHTKTLLKNRSSKSLMKAFLNRVIIC
jgi:hypothetical protein